jgi:N-acyl-D-aspartate/D-glutamate deacylase
MSEEFDILIVNGLIVDGTGSDAFRGSVAMRGDRIAEVGDDVRGDAGVVLDVGGLAVAPGFIDVHNHGDLSILYYPEAEGFLHQGITTFVGGNCGTSPGPYGDYLGFAYFLYDLYCDVAPHMYYLDRVLPRDLVNERHRELYGWEIDWHTMGEFFKRVEARGLSPNYVPLVGHGEIRTLVMGQDYRRRATRREVRRIQEEVRLAMEEGCRGLSVGRDYEPGYYADMEELVACAKIAAEYGGIYTSHSLRTGLRRERRPGEPPPPKAKGVLEAIEVGRRCKIPVQISHLSPLYDVYPAGSEVMTEASVKATLKLIDDARREGVDVSFDLIPHHLTGGIYTSPWLAGLLLPWLRVTGSRDRLAEALRMEEFRSEIKASLLSGKWYGLNPNINPNWASEPTIVSCREERFVGKTLIEVAEMLRLDPIDALMEVLARDPETKAVRRGEDDSAKLMFYKHPEMMIGIDTFAIDDKWECRHPPWYMPNENSYGGFPRYFRRAVRETKTLTLEEAVRKVTSLPSKKFKLRDRGIIRPGAYADIVVMNPEAITDMGDQLDPRRYPKGIEHVMVNGVLVVEKGRHTGAKPGRILYRE